MSTINDTLKGLSGLLWLLVLVVAGIMMRANQIETERRQQSSDHESLNLKYPKYVDSEDSTQ